MTLAQRVRDGRYAKGWGPDELASRADISRTALYQIESGKTEHPRASTLRRIAEALMVPTESLLGMLPAGASQRIEPEAIRLTPTAQPTLSIGAGWSITHRDRDIERKFTELLRTPLGEGLARIVEETYRLMPSRADAMH
jgi:transcriptional regulator with XRE-family HTH domain